jgi:hypothetical protein
MRLPYRICDLGWLDRPALHDATESIPLRAPPPESILPDGRRQAQCEPDHNEQRIGRNRMTEMTRLRSRQAVCPQNDQTGSPPRTEPNSVRKSVSRVIGIAQ